MSYLTDKKRVQGLGSAKEGVHHFTLQRITAIALLPLTVLFVLPFASNLGGEYAQVLDTYTHPFNALVAILFFLTAFTHLRLGLQVVIEDYIHVKGTRVALLLANTLFCWLMTAFGIFAVLKIAL